MSMTYMLKLKALDAFYKIQGRNLSISPHQESYLLAIYKI